MACTQLGHVCRFASTFQMLRGTLVLFAGLLTIVLLKRRLHIHHWLGMVLIVAGAALVGASSVIFDSNKRPRMEQPSAGTRRLHFLEARQLVTCWPTAAMRSPSWQASAPAITIPGAIP